MPRAPRAPKAKAKGATPSHRRTAKDSKKDVLETPEAALKTGDKIPGNTDEGPVYFWKPNDENGYLGQWYDSPWTHEGDTYETAEMWMMVGKARLFKDEKTAQEILKTSDPKRQRALGRIVTPFDDKTWNEHKLAIVTEGNYLKFTTGTKAAELRAQLLATGDRELVEASPRDRIWGIGFGAKNAGINRGRWGQNLLGKALMEVRARLREEGA